MGGTILVTGAAGFIGSQLAERLVARGDRNRADYLKRFYRVTEQPIHYDLVINTDTLTADEAADLIAQAARE